VSHCLSEAHGGVGDEQRGEDPTVNTLQQRVAELRGKEAALWFPGGTMCNFVAIKLHTSPGDAIVADGMAHTSFEPSPLALKAG
jgi:threonine aldolase